MANDGASIMAIPDFQSVMLPLIETLADGQERTMRALTDLLAGPFGLTEAERDEVLPSGQQSIFSNRVAWAKSHLKYAGLLENPARGRVRISELGRKVPGREAPRRSTSSSSSGSPPTASSSASRIGGEERRRRRGGHRDRGGSDPPRTDRRRLPVARPWRRPRSPHPAQDVHPGFFEGVVVKLLMAMGYGGVAGQGTVTGRSGDGGIDGVIRQDKLGLDVVCIQAKRWEGPVGRPVIQGFVGSMDYIRARKGVIMTTSTFTKDGLDFVDRIEGKKVVLIDGGRLAELMIEHDLGVDDDQDLRVERGLERLL